MLCNFILCKSPSFPLSYHSDEYTVRSEFQVDKLDSGAFRAVLCAWLKALPWVFYLFSIHWVCHTIHKGHCWQIKGCHIDAELYGCYCWKYRKGKNVLQKFKLLQTKTWIVKTERWFMCDSVKCMDSTRLQVGKLISWLLLIQRPHPESESAQSNLCLLN